MNKLYRKVWQKNSCWSDFNNRNILSHGKSKSRTWVIDEICSLKNAQYFLQVCELLS